MTKLFEHCAAHVRRERAAAELAAIQLDQDEPRAQHAPGARSTGDRQGHLNSDPFPFVRLTFRQHYERSSLALALQSRSRQRLLEHALDLGIVRQRGSLLEPGPTAWRLYRWNPKLRMYNVLLLLLESALRHQRGALTFGQLLSLFAHDWAGRPRLYHHTDADGVIWELPDLRVADAYEAQQRYLALLRAFGMASWNQRRLPAAPSTPQRKPLQTRGKATFPVTWPGAPS